MVPTVIFNNYLQNYKPFSFSFKFNDIINNYFILTIFFDPPCGDIGFDIDSYYIFWNFFLKYIQNFNLIEIVITNLNFGKNLLLHVLFNSVF